MSHLNRKPIINYKPNTYSYYKIGGRYCAECRKEKIYDMPADFYVTGSTYRPYRGFICLECAKILIKEYGEERFNFCMLMFFKK